MQHHNHHQEDGEQDSQSAYIYSSDSDDDGLNAGLHRHFPKEGNPNIEEIFAVTEKRIRTDSDYDEMLEPYAAKGRKKIGLRVTPAKLDASDQQLGGMDNDQDVDPMFGGVAQSPLDNDDDDTFKLSAVMAHLEQQVKLFTNPTIEFVAAIAVNAGTGLNQMLVNPQLPMVDTNARSINQLVKGSQISRHVLGALLAKILLSDDELRQEALVSVKPELSVSPLTMSGLPPVPQKLKQESAVDASIDSLIQLIGADGIGGGRQESPLQALLRQSAVVANVAKWAWSEMPASAGLILLKPEVTAVIQTAYEDIRALPNGRDIKLWHLISGPRVRYDFAIMVAGMMSAAPSEIQYPHMTSSVRGNGAVTGARVSSGKWVAARSASIYREKIAWFRHVRYVTSPVWTALEERYPLHRQRVTTARETVELARRDLLGEMNAFWGLLDRTFQVLTGELYVLLDVHLQAMNLVNEDPSPANKAAEVDALDNLKDKRTRLQSFGGRTQVGNVPTMERVLSDAGAQLVPFAPDYAPETYGLGQQGVRILEDAELDDKAAVVACKKTIAALQSVAVRTDSWKGNHQFVIFQLISKFSHYMASMHAVHLTVQAASRDAAEMAAFTDDMKKELVYERSEPVRQPRDYSRPVSIYAEI